MLLRELLLFFCVLPGTHLTLFEEMNSVHFFLLPVITQYLFTKLTTICRILDALP